MVPKGPGDNIDALLKLFVFLCLELIIDYIYGLFIISITRGWCEFIGFFHPLEVAYAVNDYNKHVCNLL